MEKELDNAKIKFEKYKQDLEQPYEVAAKDQEIYHRKS